MILVRAFVVLLLTSVAALAHEQTPAHPDFIPSFVKGIHKTTLSLFNRRADVEYYEVEVFDSEWNPIPFAATKRLLHVPYLNRTSFDIYVKAPDVRKVEYLCTQSKLFKEDKTIAVVSSRICSKVK